MADSSIKELNKLLLDEIHASLTYLMESLFCDKWGEQGLAKDLRKESGEELEHAKMLAARIIELGGEPDLDNVVPAYMPKNKKDLLVHNQGMERGAVKNYSAAIKRLGNKDKKTVTVLKEILPQEQEHLKGFKEAEG